MLTKTNIDYKKERVIRIIVTQNGSMVSWGTGFFIGKNGLIATCGHVVTGLDFKKLQEDGRYIATSGSNESEKILNYIKPFNIQAQLTNGSLVNLDIKRVDANYDIALLNIHSVRREYPFFVTELTDEPYLGEDISFYGYPLAVDHTYINSPFSVNKSLVCRYLNTQVGGGFYRHMQINVTTIGGVSGAPIFKDDQNTVVGIINGNYNHYLNNIVHRNAGVDSVSSHKISLGIGYATSLKTINDNTSIFLHE